MTDTAEQRTDTPMQRVEHATRHYAERRDGLRQLIEATRAAMDAIERDALPQIREAVGRVSEAHDQLQALITQYPELWSGKRRTVVVAGVKVGMAKGAGKLVWHDPDQVVRLIRREFPDQAETLIRSREEPIRKALGNLTVAELRRIGVQLEGTEDQVVIRPTDSQVDKLVEALLRDAERIEREAAE